MTNRYRLPAFTDDILSQIIWAMENQDLDYKLNVQDGSVYCEQESQEKVAPEYLVELPPWGSSDGYQLMVSFTIACKDPVLKAKLEAELSSKARGVFRRFRNVLASDEGVLDQWYDFKDRKMKSHIKSWYREKYGNAPKASDTEEGPLSGSDLLADYEIRKLETLDSYCSKLLSDLAKANPVYAKVLTAFEEKKAFVVVHDDHTCGALVYQLVGNDACVLSYNIDKEYRESGLFSLMFDLFNRELERHQIDKVYLPMTSETSFLRTMFANSDVKLQDCIGMVSYSTREWDQNAESAEFAYVL